MSGRRASPKDARCDRLLIVSILDLSGIDRAGIFTSIGLVRQVTDAVSDQTLLKKNIAFEVTEEDHLSIALCRGWLHIWFCCKLENLPSLCVKAQAIVRVAQ